MRLIHFKPGLAAFVLAIFALLALLWLSQRATTQLGNASGWLEHTYDVLSRLDRLQNQLELAETARRAYVIVHEEQYLRPYYQVQREMPVTLAELEQLTQDNPSQHRKLQQLMPLIDDLMLLIRQDIRQPAASLNEQVDTMNRAKRLIDQSRALSEQMRSSETALLDQRRENSAHELEDLKLLLAVISISFVGLILFSFLTLYREILQRRRTEGGLRESQALAESTVRHLSLIGEMSDLLHASMDVDEALNIVASFAARLIPVHAGAIYLFNEAEERLQLRKQWSAETGRSDFAAEDCWAMRRGEMHVSNRDQHNIACRHIGDDENCRLCVPILAQGEKLGIIHLENPLHSPFGEIEQRLAGQVALALASNRLRASLRNLSVRDPLTGLFNRRYMEESLQREIASAKRTHRPLGLMMIDLDRFKAINDQLGHEAGDQVLVALGALLLAKSRVSDIACRYGGEEFVMIYPETPPEGMLQLARQLQEAIRRLQLPQVQIEAGQVTASFGLSYFPQHGGTVEALHRAADHAMYRAKANGRDRIEQASD